MPRHMHLLKTTLTLIIAGFFLNAVQGQQRYFDERSVYQQHYIFPVLVNPGATGVDDHQTLILNYRNSWASFDDSPKTVTLNFHGPIGNRLGFGAMLFQDSYGGLESSKGAISLSYTIDSPTNKVGFGLSTEYIQHVLSGGVLNNSVVNPEDFLILQRLDGNRFFDASFGVYGIYNKQFKYGLSLPSLISSKLNTEDGPAGERDLGYIVHLGYVTMLPDSDIKIEPSVFIKSLNNIPTHVDLNVRLSFLEDRFTGGVGYTVGAHQQLGFMMGAAIGELNFFYSYGISTREFQTYNNGSHELTLAYSFNKAKKPTKAEAEASIMEK